MGLFSKDIKNMDDLFLHQVQDIYYAENQILKALPKMIDKATDSHLKTGLRSHMKETKEHVARLDQVFKSLGEKPQGHTCPAIDGIIAEAEEVAGEVEDKHVLDAAIIAAAQAVEHYEISRYGTLLAWAEQMGHKQHLATLQKTLDEEKMADKNLTSMAESKINHRAAS